MPSYEKVGCCSYSTTELSDYHKRAIKSVRATHKGHKVYSLGWRIRVHSRGASLVSIYCVEGDSSAEEHNTAL